MQQIGWARQPAVVEDILTWVITDALWNKEVQTMRVKKLEKDFRFDADPDADADADAIPGPEDTPEGKMGNRRDALLRAIFG
jgi:hypothetical protein